MYILGLNAFHGDSSACIVKDGNVIVALEEERIRRIKHWAGFPIEAIKYCLTDAGITIKDIDYITISRDPSANVLKKIKHTLKNTTSISAILDRYSNSKKVKSVKGLLAEAFGMDEKDIKAEIHNIEHHRSHLASAFFASPFEKAALLSIDGFGDFTSTMTAVGNGNQMEILDAVHFPHSAGIFYTSFTQYLGFPHYGDEYKIMGLAPYGKPIYLDKLRDVIEFTPDGLFKLNLKYFKHHKDGVKMSWEGGEPDIESIYSPYMVEKFGPVRKREEELTQYHKDLAASVQRITEELIFHILNHLYKKCNSDNLCIAGGVAQNSVANGKILQNTPFKNVYIPPAGHDAGTSIGSALFLYNQVLKNKRVSPTYSGSLGSQFSDHEIENYLKSKEINFKRYTDSELYDKVSDCVINGGVVGWFQGRAEFGPRALGHRSIIADPRRVDAKEILNLKIKRRESFRPFAPSILKDFAAEYFEGADHVPFMEKVYLIKSAKREQIPAVTHVDGTGRLQTVDVKFEPRYHALISAFHKKTGVPILLNTSFNENEPIVNSPANALDCFLRTKMDMLVLENYIITR
ncbi:MAG TPA: carbamoyltransferase C-terminal domain-containing protein [Bacteroidia bacterium]|jgi:carbamoyltransferase|nr:carbamoyltransferase C-terminal domain-containing protein [Bacteroidia bacterium]